MQRVHGILTCEEKGAWSKKQFGATGSVLLPPKFFLITNRISEEILTYYFMKIPKRELF